MSLQSTNTETSSFVAPALLVSRFRHVYWPTSSAIIHNHPVSEGKATALWWVVQLLPSPGKCDRAKPWTALHILHEYARISWHNSESSANPGTVMIMWWCLKHLETVRTALDPAFAQVASMISSPGLAVNAWAAGVLLDLLASIYLFYFQFKAPGGFAHFLNLQISRSLQWITSCRHSENDMWAQQRRVNENHGPVNKPHITANHSKSWAPTDWISSSMSPFSSALRCWSIARAWPVLEKRL